MQTTYVRTRAARYALNHYNNPNPLYANMDTMGGGGDCTNFTSQCMLAGGYTMDYRATGQATEWWYRRIGTDRFDSNNNDWWSCTWAVPENQFQYLRANGGRAVDLLANPSLARRLSLADIIYYDWTGEGFFGHSAIITNFNRYHVPYVTYRTLSPLRPVRRGHWSLRFRREAKRIWAIHLDSFPEVYPQNPNWNVLVPCDTGRRTISQGTSKLWYPTVPPTKR